MWTDKQTSRRSKYVYVENTPAAAVIVTEREQKANLKLKIKSV